MAIKAVINEPPIIDKDGSTVIRVVFTDSLSFKTLKEYRENPFNLEHFKARVNGDLHSFVVPEDPKSAITVGDFDPTPTAPQETPEEKARLKFIQDLSLRRQMDKAIALGLMNPSDKSYADQVQLVADEFIPEYVVVL